MIAENVSMKRLRRFGMDRLYVNTADGNQIGWVDLGTGERVIESPAHAHIFKCAVEECTGARPGARGSPTLGRLRRVSPEPEESPPRHVYVSSVGEDLQATPAAAARPACDLEGARSDLANNGPGQAVRTNAIAAERTPVTPLRARVRRVQSDEPAWRMGEKVEQLVAADIGKLGERWHVLQAVPIGAEVSDINHLVIGPAGVLSLNAKHHRNAAVWVGGDVVMVNGYRQPDVRNSRLEAERVGRLLSTCCGLPVVAAGVVVSVNARSVTIWDQPEDVHIIDRRRLPQWLLSLPTMLDRARVDRIFDAARQSSTWAQQ